MVVVAGCWDGGGGDGGWGWETADVACASYAGVGVGRLGWGLGRVNEVEHGARHCAFFFFFLSCGWLGLGWWRRLCVYVCVCMYVCVLYRRERYVE